MNEYNECPECGLSGIADYDIFKPAIFQCTYCNHVFSYIWCKKCGMGGDFLHNIELKPKTWKCFDCKSEITIPDSTYSRYVKLIEGTEEARQEASVPGTSTAKNNSTRSLAIPTIIIFLLAILYFNYFKINKNTVIESSSDNNTLNINKKSYQEKLGRELQLVFSKHKNELYSAYNRHLKQHPVYSDKLLYKIILDPQGNLLSVTLAKSTNKNTSINNDLMEIISNMKFNIINKLGNNSVFYYPI
ncbi:MAG: hypothetical protein ACN4GM_09015 [Gammaproteobacteria bacterium]